MKAMYELSAEANNRLEKQSQSLEDQNNALSKELATMKNRVKLYEEDDEEEFQKIDSLDGLK